MHNCVFLCVCTYIEPGVTEIAKINMTMNSVRLLDIGVVDLSLHFEIKSDLGLEKVGYHWCTHRLCVDVCVPAILYVRMVHMFTLYDH